MAKTLGKAGRYVTNEADRAYRRMLVTGVGVIFIVGICEGLALASWFRLPALPAWSSAIVSLCLVCLVIGLSKWIDQRMDLLNKKRKIFRRGAEGEIAVGCALEKLPDDYFVIHDIKNTYGNIDHVVVGPTGVYAIDAKNWRGCVSSDGKGELLLNGKPTDKPYVKQFISRMLSIKDKIKTLSTGSEIFYKPVFVFTAARIEASWGTTSRLHCMREDQLCDYIENKNQKHLSPEQARQIAQAFLALAHMESDFTEQSNPKEIKEKAA